MNENEPTAADLATADKLCEWLEPTCEPAGASGAFWRASGPRGANRWSALVDIGAHKRAIAKAIADARASAAPKEGEVERLRAECDMLRREVSREASLSRKVHQLLDEHCRYTAENKALDNVSRSALSPASEGGGA